MSKIAANRLLKKRPHIIVSNRCAFGFGMGGRVTAADAKELLMETEKKQLLHLVFGGELDSLDEVTFRDLDNLDVVGIFPDYQSAYEVWKSRAQKTVDNAHMRYFIVHLHKLLNPEAEAHSED